MKKRFALAVIVITAIALSLVGCGVKVTNISVPDAATLEKGESITLPVNFGTEDAPAETPVEKRGRRSRFNDLHRPLFVKAFARRNVEKNR